MSSASASRSALAALLIAISPDLAHATARFVSPDGLDWNPGTISQPFRTLPIAIGTLVAGDTLYVRGGTYHQWNLGVTVSGAPGAPIVIRSYPGETAVIDPTFELFRTPGNYGWGLVDGAIGEYQTHDATGEWPTLAWVADVPGYENRRIALIPYYTSYPSNPNFVATTEQYNATAFYAGPGMYEPNNHVNVRLSKTAEVRALEQRIGPIFSEDVPHPADYPIVVTGAGFTLGVQGSYLVFQDLVLEPGYNTVHLFGNTHDVRFEGMKVWVGRTGFTFESPGIHDVTITRCSIFGDCPPWVFRSDADSDVPPAPAQKLRSTSIDLEKGGQNVEISYNHIRGSAQYLIACGSDPFTAHSTSNLLIHHNRLENAAEDAIRLAATTDLGRVEVYENFVSNCLRAVSTGQGTPFTGPLLVYRNVVSLLRDPPVNRVPGLLTWNGGKRYGFEYLFKLSGTGFTTQNAHVYHNTLAILNSAGKGINLAPQNTADGRFANNLMIAVNGRVNGAFPAGAGRVVDGNLYWKMNTVDTERLVDTYDTVAGLFAAQGLEQHGIGATPKRGTDPQLPGLDLEILDPTQSVWALAAGSERREPWDFALAATSPARDAGIEIPAHPVLGTLPDTRASRDIGALPYGVQASDFDFFPFDPTPNQPPAVEAGPTQLVTLPARAALAGQVVDDGNPASGTLIHRWSVLRGPGRVTFDQPYALATPASFSAGGTYTLVLAADDGSRSALDSVTIVVEAPFHVVDAQVTASSDDAEENGAGTASTFSPDLDMMRDGTGLLQRVGVRFTGIDIPSGSTIARAWVQFTRDEAGGDVAALTVRAQAADDAPTFANTLGDLSGRTRTVAAVAWDPVPWTVAWASGEAERTSDLAVVVQEVIDRPGWQSGNALVVLINGGGAGTRIARAFDDSPGEAPRLHVEYGAPEGILDADDLTGARLEARVAPNPVVREGTLRLMSPRAGSARVQLFDVRGRRVSVLLERESLAPGVHEVAIPATLAPGVYFYRVRIGGEVTTGRFLVMR